MKNNAMLHNQESSLITEVPSSLELLYMPSSSQIARLVAAYKVERKGISNSFTQMNKEVKIAAREIKKAKKKKIKYELVKLFINKKEVGGAFFQYSNMRKYCILNILFIDPKERNKGYGEILVNEYLRFVERHNLIPVIELEKGNEEHCRYYYKKWGFTQTSSIFFTESVALINPSTVKHFICTKVLDSTISLLQSWCCIIPDKEILIQELLLHLGGIDPVLKFLAACCEDNNEALKFLKSLINTNKISIQKISAA